MRLLPDHCGKKSSHHRRSSFALAVRGMWWWSFDTVVLKLTSLCRNMQPAGNTLQVNNSFQSRKATPALCNYGGVWDGLIQRARPAFVLVLCSLPWWWCLTEYLKLSVIWLGPLPWKTLLVHWSYCRGKALQLGCSCSDQCWNAQQRRNHPSSVASVLLHDCAVIPSELHLTDGWTKRGQNASRMGGRYLHKNAGAIECSEVSILWTYWNQPECIFEINFTKKCIGT